VNEFLDQMVRTDLHGHPILKASEQGLSPIYFDKTTRPDPDPIFPEIIELSGQMWAYMGYSGLMKPWHEEDPYKYLKIKRDNFRMFLYRMDEMDVHWKSYLVLSCLMTPYEMWERPTLLLNQRIHWTWFEKFREHAGSREAVDEVAFFMLEFIRLQIEHRRRAYFGKGVFVGPEPKSFSSGKRAPKKYLVLYHRITDRIRSLKAEGVDYLWWLQQKFSRCVEISPDDHVGIMAIVNVNALDPDMRVLKKTQNDPWRPIREFLGLSAECDFPDSCIPKGWRPSSDDSEDASQIVSIRADGYYYYSDGTQRRGKRHYANNKYLCISCLPENFVEFKHSWDDARLLSGSPTWEEYSKWGLYPDIWNDVGINVSPYRAIRDVRWRKRG